MQICRKETTKDTTFSSMLRKEIVQESLHSVTCSVRCDYRCVAMSKCNSLDNSIPPSASQGFSWHRGCCHRLVVAQCRKTEQEIHQSLNLELSLPRFKLHRMLHMSNPIPFTKIAKDPRTKTKTRNVTEMETP
jgi:hypothetical protein